MDGVELRSGFGNENGVGLEGRDGAKDGFGSGTGSRLQMGSGLWLSPHHMPTARLPEGCPAASRQSHVYSHCVPTAHDLDPPLKVCPRDRVHRSSQKLPHS